MTTPILSQTTRGAIGRAGATDLEDQAGWLELARRQSQALAEGEAGRVRPWRWQALAEEPAARGRFFRWFVLRPSWAVVILVLALAGSVAVGAYVARRSAPPAKPALRTKRALGAPPVVEAPKTKAAVGTVVEPAEIVEAREELAPDPKRPAAAKAPEKPSPEEKIILGPNDTDGAGEMIIVPAPRKKKLEPLFTPEDYKKKGRRGTRF